jgi:cell division protein ZapE
MDGLNRQLFLPFIALLKAHCDVETLDAAKDFRRDRLAHVGAYQTPLGPKADRTMDEAWRFATAGEHVARLDLMVRGHKVAIPAATKSAARFTFEELCAKPLGAADYMELAERYPTIFIDHVPELNYAKRNEAKRFIILIDVLYDNGNRLFLSAERGPDDIYQVPQGLKVGEFTRASSRLVQMTSVDWLEAWEKKREIAA